MRSVILLDMDISTTLSLLVVLLTGVLLAPEVPLEELFFLLLLCYSTMDLVGFVRPVVQRSLGRRRP